MWLAKVNVVLKPVVNDPEGLAIQGGLKSLGFEHVTDVRSGKLIEIRLESPDRKSAREAVISMCKKLLANPVMEDYLLQVEES